MRISRPCHRCPGSAGGGTRVGKKIAGRRLDGRTWDEMPEMPEEAR